ncbi:TetR/AcrR family transcriptional regulator [Rhodococcus spongiicola]|uniref:TetR/AcrR family transcriptional regulator n=1 Tax=Rhodococcus spongiicola TaxID=2487352 RepID=A0A3S3CPH4_9NOCA|nr:TetR/AcrR family transcriptional regulator [Rhodococcus spongiicola]RVW02509.1 TetR/AcrR family transcriptional regulator [Rhodococcus spongiicola]
MHNSTTLDRRERNKRQTRGRLLASASGLFAEQGVDGTTVEDIADGAHVSRATFFNYFPSKDELLADLHTSHMDALAGVIDDLLTQDLTTGDRIVRLFDDFVQTAKDLPGYLRVVTGEQLRDLASPEVSVERTEHFNEQILRILEPGIECGEVRTDYSPMFLAEMVSAIYTSTIRCWRQDRGYDLEDGFGKAARYAAESVTPRP